MPTTNDQLQEHPDLAFAPNEQIGRVYHKPGVKIDHKHYKLAEVKKLIRTGELVPSTTNIISVRNSPYLLPWASRLVAKTAVDMARNNPNFVARTKANQYGAIDYLKNAPTRERDFWGNQGSRIHLACELLAKQQPVDMVFTQYEQQSVDQWKKWLDHFQPVFEHMEITGFGKTKDNKLGYAHTTDVIMKINNKRLIGDYKCVTDDTPILMFDGTTRKAIDIKEGDEVVAWDKNGLHTAKVSYAGDNGYHKVATITTVSGHKLTTTLNHPYWSSRKSQQLSWVEAENLKIGDEVYIAMGWNYSQHRSAETPWPYTKYFSPYLFGVLWALRNFKPQEWAEDKFIEIPPISKETLKTELHESAFRFTKAGKLGLRKGLNKIAAKNNTTVQEILNVIDTPNLPAYLYSANSTALFAFFTGVREVFANKELSEDEIIIFLNKEAATNLQQLFSNYGQPTTIVTDPRTGQTYLKTPFEENDTIFTHGPTATRITSIEITEEEHHTVALEVAGAHTHVTGGIITHNTNRSGLHIDVALQLAANARGTEITTDNKTLEPMPEIEGAVGIHISPKGVVMNRVDISEPVYDTFQSLRRVWDFHAFEGSLSEKHNVIQEVIKNPEEV